MKHTLGKRHTLRRTGGTSAADRIQTSNLKPTLRNLDRNDISPFIRREGLVTFEVVGRNLTLDMKNKHERLYAAKLFLNLRHAQSDLDDLVFRRFIKKGDVVLDGGANIGFTALEMLALGAAQVISLEPVSYIYQRLAQLAGDDLIALNFALADVAGQTDIYLSQAHNQGSTIEATTLEFTPKTFGNDLVSERVSLTTIDQLVAENGRFDIWKLDLEDAEVKALKGASMALRDQPPRMIFVELWDHNKPDSARAIPIATAPTSIRKTGNCCSLRTESPGQTD